MAAGRLGGGEGRGGGAEEAVLDARRLSLEAGVGAGVDDGDGAEALVEDGEASDGDADLLLFVVGGWWGGGVWLSERAGRRGARVGRRQRRAVATRDFAATKRTVPAQVIQRITLKRMPGAS